MGNSSSSLSRDQIHVEAGSSKGVPRRRRPFSIRPTPTHAENPSSSSGNRLLAPTNHRRVVSTSAATRPTHSQDINNPAPPPPYSVAVASSNALPSEQTRQTLQRPTLSSDLRRSSSALATRSSASRPEDNVTPTQQVDVQRTSTDSGLTSHGSRHTNFYTTPSNNSLNAEGSSTSRNGRTGSYLRAPMRRETQEDALETLRNYDTVIIVDDSKSMFGDLWQEARNALATLAEIAGQYDTNGIDIYFLNSTKSGQNIKMPDSIQRLFDSVRPRGATPLGSKLESLLLNYLARLENSSNVPGQIPLKPVNFIVITDGCPTDDPETVIIAAAKRLDAGNWPLTQVGIQFVQIGNSRKATAYLKELDDGLVGVRDIVDTTPYSGELTAVMLTKILLGGINRRVDRKGGQTVME